MGIALTLPPKGHGGPGLTKFGQYGSLVIVGKKLESTWIGTTMSSVKITRTLAALDTGNRAMRKAGRTAWSEEDWNVMCSEFERRVLQVNYEAGMYEVLVELSAEQVKSLPAR